MKFEPGKLYLKDGFITFASDAHGLLFRAPLDEVRASFPKVIFPVPYFGIGVKVVVNGKTYRLSFMAIHIAAVTQRMSGSDERAAIPGSET